MHVCHRGWSVRTSLMRRVTHRHQEFLSFLTHVARVYPTGELHLVMDNYATHKHAKVKHSAPSP